MKIKILSAILFLSFLVCCSKENPSNEQQPFTPNVSYTFKEDVFPFEKEMTSSIEVTPDSVIVINDISQIPSVKNIYKGQTIFAPITETTPEGIMGTVESIKQEGNKMSIKFSLAGIEDVFSDLRIELDDIDLLDGVDYLEDEQGNKYQLKTLETKAGDNKKVKKIPFENEYVKGELTVDLHVEKPVFYMGQDGFRFIINQYEKIESEIQIGVKREGGFSIPVLKRTPIPINVGNIFLFRPYVVLESGFEFLGDAEIGAVLSSTLVDDKYVLSNESGTPKVVRYPRIEKPIYDWNVHWLKLAGSMSYFCSCAIQYAFWREEMMATGIQAKASYNTEFGVSFDPGDKKLLEINPYVKLYPKLEITGYAHMRLTKNSPKKRYETPPLSFTFNETEICLLPKFDNDKVTRSKTTISASANLNRECYLSSKEQGFALFKKDNDTPLQHKQCFMTATKAISADEDEATFTVSGDPDEYEIKEYVKGEDMDGNDVYWYKPIIPKVKSINIKDKENRNIDFLFCYNDAGDLEYIDYHDDNSSYRISVEYSSSSIVFRCVSEIETGYYDKNDVITSSKFVSSGSVRYSLSYTYSNGRITNCTMTDSYGTYSINNRWENDMFISNEYCRYTYSNLKNNSNINWIALVQCMCNMVLTPICQCNFLALIMSGVSSSYLPNSVSVYDGHDSTYNLNFSYVCDEDGKINTVSVSNAFTLSFVYE